MADLLKLSSKMIDEGVVTSPPNRVTQELSEIADGISIVESFSHSITFKTDDGLVVFDTSGVQTGPAVVQALRTWSSEPVHTMVYTHGHLDHVGGSGAFVADATDKGRPRPRAVGHRNVALRLERYGMTSGYNRVINARQFGGFKGMFDGLVIGEKAGSFVPANIQNTDLSFRDNMALSIGGLGMQLNHDKGETDDHLWAWIPDRKIICAGDFFIWNFPNAGNPQKVQRYPVEWAEALRKMAGMGAELFIPSHGLPIAGADRIRMVLGEVVKALEGVITQTLAMMNMGLSLNHIVHEVKVDPKLLSKPYLRPLYDEPEFVVRNIWRLYGGWYDGNPANLKPASDAALAKELCGLSGGVEAVVGRALALAEAEDFRLACHLVELAVQAAPKNKAAHATRYEIYKARRKKETSMMAKGIFGSAARESEAITNTN